MGKTKKAICYLLAFIIMMQGSVAYADTISDLKKQNEENQEKLDEANSQVDDLTGEQEGVTEEISALSEEITLMMTDIEVLEEEISELQTEIENCKVDLENAKAEEEKQKEAMMKRIKYMYEEGDSSIVEVLLSAVGLSDLLNRADYVEDIYAYDNEMLEEYKAARQEVEDLEAELEEEESELETTLAEYEEEQTAMEAELTELKALSSQYDTLITKAKQQAAAYKKQIAANNAQIKKLEEEEAKKKAAAAAAAKKTAAGTATVDSASIMACNGSELGKKIAIYACSFVGNPYVAGGTSLTNGADCSGFTQSVYKNFGYSIPRTSYAQRSAGTEVSYSDAQPGDIICYAGHVALYIGNGRIVHASSAKTGIKLGYATYREIITVRRIVN